MGRPQQNLQDFMLQPNFSESCWCGYECRRRQSVDHQMKGMALLQNRATTGQLQVGGSRNVDWQQFWLDNMDMSPDSSRPYEVPLGLHIKHAILNYWWFTTLILSTHYNLLNLQIYTFLDHMPTKKAQCSVFFVFFWASTAIVSVQVSSLDCHWLI